MPIFEYRCEDCNTKFEKLVRTGDHVSCPSCGQDHLKTEYSTFAPRANGVKAEPSAPSCPGGMCRTPGMCGLN